MMELEFSPQSARLSTSVSVLKRVKVAVFFVPTVLFCATIISEEALLLAGLSAAVMLRSKRMRVDLDR